MLGHTRKPLTRNKKAVVRMQHAGVIYVSPKKIAEQYRVDDDSVSVDDVFASINKQHTRPGALLRGIRVRENLTQLRIAAMVEVIQSDVSQMENGARSIGRSSGAA